MPWGEGAWLLRRFRWYLSVAKRLVYAQAWSRGGAFNVLNAFGVLLLVGNGNGQLLQSMWTASYVAPHPACVSLKFCE
jgi:hypothetical protein